VNSLAALRREDGAVFRDTHALVMDLVRSGLVTGLRIDHPDGLYDPPTHFRRLQAAARARGEGEPGARPGGESPERVAGRVEAAMRLGMVADHPLYVVVEKVLAPGERMPDGWAVDGTTGYDFLNSVNGLFVDPGSSRSFARAYARSGGRHASFPEEAYAKRRLVCGSLMASEVRMLASFAFPTRTVHLVGPASPPP
jgi:(1->4)-alpha-D-glucan 1-alpha-D-glucosylmutase